MKLLEAINTTCPLAELEGFGVNVTTPACKELLDVNFTKELGGYYEYSLFDDCWY